MIIPHDPPGSTSARPELGAGLTARRRSRAAASRALTAAGARAIVRPTRSSAQNRRPMPRQPPAASPALIALAEDLPHGRCVALRIPTEPDALLPNLHPEEAAHAATLAPARRRTWAAGRVALRQALADRGGQHPAPIFATPRGAPLLQDSPSLCASISHKDSMAVALVALVGTARPSLVGIDLESWAPRRYDIASRVLTTTEQAAVACLAAPERARAILLLFSIKEAIYKAVDPVLRRFVPWSDVELEVPTITTPSGTVRVLTGFPGASIETTFRSLEGHWITTARAQFDRSSYQ